MQKFDTLVQKILDLFKVNMRYETELINICRVERIISRINTSSSLASLALMNQMF